MHCGKAGVFRSVPGTLIHQQGEQVSWLSFWRIEKWMWHVFKRQDGRVVGAGCLGARGKRYKLFWMGGKEKTDGVGIFVAEKWVDSVVSVERRSERVMIVKLVIDSGLLNVLTVHCGRKKNVAVHLTL